MSTPNTEAGPDREDRPASRWPLVAGFVAVLVLIVAFAVVVALQG